MSAQVDPDQTTPIIYGRPRFLAPVLLVAVVGSVVGALISYLTYGNVNTASREDVLGNRAVTQSLKELIARYEVENEAHRERNEEAHACDEWLLARVLINQGDPMGRQIMARIPDPNPCGRYVAPGVVPPVTTTTTPAAPRKHTTTTSRKSRKRSTTTTATTAPATSSQPTRGTTTTACVARRNTTCVSAP